MARQKLSYKEGDWFAVPLGPNEYALGVVARMNGRGGILGYFFGPKFEVVPPLETTEGLTVKGAIFVSKFGDLGFLEGTWKVIGRHGVWRREEWPIPAFVRTDVISGKHRKVVYPEDDFSTETQLIPIDPVAAEKLPEDGTFGAGAVELRLTKLLSIEKSLNT